MTTVTEPDLVNAKKLMDFVFRAVDEGGATLNAAPVVGDRRVAETPFNLVFEARP
jgi:hypothetical protein